MAAIVEASALVDLEAAPKASYKHDIQTDGWRLPPPYLIPTEPKDYGYVDMNRVGDPLVEPKKRPKWHQYGGHYRPVRPGIPWMPSPEITSPLPLPTYTRLSSEDPDTSCTTQNPSPATPDESQVGDNLRLLGNKQRGQRNLSYTRSSQSDNSLSSQSHSSDEYDSSNSPGSVADDGSEQDDELLASEELDTSRGSLFSTSSRDEVEFDRTLFGGRPLFPFDSSNITLSPLPKPNQRLTLVGSLKTFRRRFLARLRRTESVATGQEEGAARSAVSSGSPPRITADFMGRWRTPSLSLDPLETLQGNLTSSSPVSWSASIESERECSIPEVNGQAPPVVVEHLALMEDEGPRSEIEVEGPGPRVFDLIGLPSGSSAESIGDDRPSSIRGVFSVYDWEDGHEDTSNLQDSPEGYGVRQNLLGLTPEIPYRPSEDNSPPLLGSCLGLRIFPGDAEELDSLQSFSSSLPGFNLSTGILDRPLSRNSFNSNDQRRSEGEETPGPASYYSHQPSSGGLLDASADSSAVWHFEPLDPDGSGYCDPLDWLARSTTTSVDSTTPNFTNDPVQDFESFNSLPLNNPLPPIDATGSTGAVEMDPTLILWPERAQTGMSNDSTSPCQLNLQPISPPTPLETSHAGQQLPTQQVFRQEPYTNPIPSLANDISTSERAFIERVRRKQVEARNCQRRRQARLDAKEDDPEQRKLSRKFGLPGTQDWRRFVMKTPSSYGPLRFREYLSFTQAMLQLEYYPSHHLETIAIASWYHYAEMGQILDKEGSVSELASQTPKHNFNSPSSTVTEAIVQDLVAPRSAPSPPSPLDTPSTPPTIHHHQRVRFEIDQELVIPPPLTPKLSKVPKLYPNLLVEWPQNSNMTNSSTTWATCLQAQWMQPDQPESDCITVAHPPAQTGWPTAEQLECEAAMLKQRHRAHYEVPEEINNTALLMWYPPDLRDGQGPVFEVVSGETAISAAESPRTDGMHAREPISDSNRHSPLPGDLSITGKPSIAPGQQRLHPSTSPNGISVHGTPSTPLTFSPNVPFEEQTPAFRTVELPQENSHQHQCPVDILRVRRELKYKELPPANLPLTKIVCPHEWKAYGYFARPIIENVDMYNTPSPWLGHCNLDPDNPRDPYAPVKDVEATLWLDTDTTPEEVLFRLKDHPDDKPLPERWQVGVVHACLPPKPLRWKTPEPDAPDPSPLEIQLNPYLEHLLYGAQRMSWDIRHDSLTAYLGFQDYKGLFPLRPQDLAQPASFPFVKRMDINALADDNHTKFFWPIPVENPEGVKVRDVIFAIFRSFQQDVTQEEYNRFPDWKRRECAHWRERRCAPDSSESWARARPTTGTPGDSLKRIDWLGAKTVFRGLSYNPGGTGWVLYLGQRDSF